MIRLVFATDSTNMIGVKNPKDVQERMSTWPKGLPEVFFPEYYQGAIVCGTNTYFPFFHESGSKNAPVYVLSHKKDADLKGNPYASVETDFKKLVAKYSNSDDVLIVAGGKMTWETFLPYADELKVGITDEIMAPGDILFDAWKSINLEEVNRKKWDGGQTITYKVIK